MSCPPAPVHITYYDDPPIEFDILILAKWFSVCVFRQELQRFIHWKYIFFPIQMKLFIHKNGLNFRDGTQNGNKRSQLVRGELGAKDGSLKDSVGSDHDNRGSVPRHQNRDYEISSFWDVVRSKRFMDDGWGARGQSDDSYHFHQTRWNIADQVLCSTRKRGRHWLVHQRPLEDKLGKRKAKKKTVVNVMQYLRPTNIGKNKYGEIITFTLLTGSSDSLAVYRFLHFCFISEHTRDSE